MTLIFVLWLSTPDFPVTVTVKVPVVARLPADRVSVLELVAGFWLNAAVVPLCKPEADSVTPPLKPFNGVTVMIVPALLPRPMLKVAGEADKLKFGAAFTVRESVVELFRVPLTPLMVTVNVPTAALGVAVNVRVLVVAVLDGVKFAVTPLGKPEADRLTPPAKPFCGLTVIVVAPPLVP